MTPDMERRRWQADGKELFTVMGTGRLRLAVFEDADVAELAAKGHNGRLKDTVHRLRLIANDLAALAKQIHENASAAKKGDDILDDWEIALSDSGRHALRGLVEQFGGTIK